MFSHCGLREAWRSYRTFPTRPVWRLDRHHGVTEQLIELLLVRSMGSLNLAVKLRRTGLDIGVAVARANFLNAKWENFDHMIHEVYCVGLCRS